MKAVVIGASAGVGRALSEILAKQGNELLLVARDARDLEALAADLRLRYNTRVHVLADDVANPECERLRDFTAHSLGQIDALLMIAGMTDSSDCGAMDDDRLEIITHANFVGPVRVINALLPLCSAATHIVAASSVAAIRPRGHNAVYGAAKVALEHYCMAARHAHASRLRSVCCYRLGYIRTSMTFGQKLHLPSVSARAVADMMVRRLGENGIVYFPGWWAWVAVALRMLPWRVFRKIQI